MIISNEYKQECKQLHETVPDWGTGGRKYAPVVERIVKDYAPKNILDYGCGKQTLSRELSKYRIIGYDPALPGLDELPAPADLVICTDVLEHIEPDCLEDVLDDLERVVRCHLFAVVVNRRASQYLPDGRNCHLIIESHKWWIDKLWSRFDLLDYHSLKIGFSALFGAKHHEGNGLK